MSQSKSVVFGEFKSNPYLLINIVFAFFPVSFVIGSLFVNINLFLFCSLGIFYLRLKIFNDNLNFALKIISLFFILILFSTIFHFIKTFYLVGYTGINIIPECYNVNCYSALTQLVKSILFLRFFLLMLIVYLLNKLNILNFKYFFSAITFVVIVISLDIIFQYIFGYNTIGLKNSGFYNSGFFGNELMAGGFILRLSFVAIFFTIFMFKNKNYYQYIFPAFVTSIVGIAMLFSGNRMPLVFFIFGLFLFIFLVLFLNLKIKKILFISILSLFLSFQIIALTNNQHLSFLKQSFTSFIGAAKTMINVSGIQKWKKTSRVENKFSLGTKTTFYTAKHESLHKRIFLAALDTWKNYSVFEKIFGGGIKSFRANCWKLEKLPDFYLGDALMPGKKNRICATHPHNYYLEILTEMGVLGIIIASLIGFMLFVFFFKNLQFFKFINFESFALLSIMISLILETFPIKSTGSLFTTNNATYLILISSIILCHKTLMKEKNEKN